MRSIVPAFAAAVAVMSCGAAARAQDAPAAARQARPIPGAGNWVLQQRLPGMPGRVCTVRTEGPEANTTIVLNNDRRPVLIVGRHDWSGLSGEAEVSLSIDDAPAIEVDAMMVHNLVLVLIADDRLMERLRDAEMLRWTFPFGRFRAAVGGLGGALDALAACRPDDTP